MEDGNGEENREIMSVEERPIQKMPVTGVVVPLVDVDEALKLWKAFEDFKQKMLVPWGKKGTDYQRIKVNEKQPDGSWKTVDKDFPKKSAARKFGKFFGISDGILEKMRVDRADGSFVWHYTVQAWAPNGQIVTAEGVCDSKEKKSLKLEHDVKTTAHTRAKSRAIFDLVGGGEVTAEEMTLGGYTSEQEVIEAEYNVKEHKEKPERAPGIGPPPKKVDVKVAPVERQRLPKGVASLEELEYIFLERIPGYGELLDLVPGSDGFILEHKQSFDEEIEALVEWMVSEMGGERLKRAGLYGRDWTVPLKEAD